MFSSFLALSPIRQALISGLFTFSITTLGSALILFFKEIKKFVLDAMLAISAGIMLAASFFSLLNPAIELTNSWILISTSFILGGILLLICDNYLNKLCHKNNSLSSLKASLMLFISITLHNIPEGLVIGVAYASVTHNNIIGALSLTLGIAIQNFPEGSAISFPLRRDGISKFKSFMFGSLSAIVEPIAAMIGAFLVLKIQSLLPAIMSFTAGAMIFVTVLELIPESQGNKKQGLMTLFLMLGFALMMILEIAL